MRYFLAIAAPPLCVLSCFKPFSAVLNLFLTCLGYFPGRWHAVSVLNNYYANKRNGKLVNAINHPQWIGQVVTQPKQERLKLPKAKVVNPTYNDPSIGVHGTQYKKRVNR